MNHLTSTLPELSVLIPAYNEGDGLERALSTIGGILSSISPDWEIIVIDDGSQDNTYQRVCTVAQTEMRVKGISFSRNFGKEAALLAGLKYAQGRAVIAIDADLQHPPE